MFSRIFKVNVVCEPFSLLSRTVSTVLETSIGHKLFHQPHNCHNRTDDNARLNRRRGW
uniref:Uncharacterized protein n=1 Tax=Ciona intestinalis TaxID=7719 RepID=H2Y3A7_CIOIN